MKVIVEMLEKALGDYKRVCEDIKPGSLDI